MKANEQRPRWGRRGFLKGVGASALGTAVVVFGAPERASAHYYHYGCCHLLYRASSYPTCRANRNYTWYCYVSPRSCSCCERQDGNGRTFASAYYCDNS